MVMAKLHCDDGGFLTIQFVAAVALSLLIFVLIANAVLVQYARGVVRAAAEEGAQAGSRLSADESDCVARADEVLEGLLGGSMGDDVTVSCTIGPSEVAATVRYSFTPWLPVIPTWSGTQTSFAVKERIP
jgi:hypothetical protein